MTKNKPRGIPSMPRIPQPPSLPSVPAAPAVPGAPGTPGVASNNMSAGMPGGSWLPIPPGILANIASGVKAARPGASGPDIAAIVERVSKIIAATRTQMPAGVNVNANATGGPSPERIAELIKKYGPKSA